MQLNPDLFTLANNHILDQGIPGLESTKKALCEANIAYTGIRRLYTLFLKPFGERQMIKVLMTSTNSFQRHGVTNVMLNLYRELDREEFQVDFVANREPDRDIREEIESRGGRIFVIPRSTSHPVRFIRSLAEAARGYDILHAHGNSATLALEMAAAKRAGVSVRIAHSHNTFCLHRTADRLLRPLFYRTCTGRLACGNGAGKWLFGKRPFTIIHNGIDADRFRFDHEARERIRASLGWENKKVIGHVGGFVAAKNHAFLLDVFAELYRADRDFRLLLLGDGGLRPQIEERLRLLGLSDAVFLAGSTGRVAEHLSAMDLVVMPSKWEGLPLTLIEEQANGLSCLVSDTVTTDANLTGNLRYLPLSAGAKAWAQEILIAEFGGDRNAVSARSVEIIKEKGYDSRAAARQLEIYYSKCLNDD